MSKVLTPTQLNQLQEVIYQAKESNYRENASCAGRVYVCFGEKLRANSKLLKQLSKFFRVTKRPYCGNLNFLYIGYDNFSGLELTIAKAVASKLNDLGVRAYWDGDAD